MSQGKIIRIILVALPLGLVLLSVVSMVSHHLKPDIPVYDENYTKRIQAAKLNQKAINGDDLERHVDVLVNDIGIRNYSQPEALHRAEFYIQSSLKGALGYEIKKQILPVGDQEFVNVTAEITGSKKYKEIIVIGAHYDSTAANDNSTGVAALLSIAKAMAGSPNSRTVRFVFFSNGTAGDAEQKNRGSWEYARRQVAESQRVITMLNIDSIGHYSEQQSWPDGVGEGLPEKGDFLALCADDVSKSWLSNIRGSLKRESIGTLDIESSIPMISDSDHRSFWNYQFPAVLVTDTGSFRQASPSNIDYDKLAAICRALKSNLETWANPQ